MVSRTRAGPWGWGMISSLRVTRPLRMAASSLRWGAARAWGWAGVEAAEQVAPEAGIVFGDDEVSKVAAKEVLTDAVEQAFDEVVYGVDDAAAVEGEEGDGAVFKLVGELIGGAAEANVDALEGAVVG